ncbi:MAG: DUF1592 domain-containing protein [Planctomycetota bacterium]
MRVPFVLFCFMLCRPLLADTVPISVVDLIESACVDCHNADDRIAGLDLQPVVTESIYDHLPVWEKVIRKLRTAQMPPRDAYRPDPQAMAEATQRLEDALEQVSRRHPNPGRVSSFRRMTRFEYGNAIRDLLALNVDVTSLLPADEVSHGFDNITVGDLSPTRLNRYVSAAQQISRLAVGRAPATAGGKTYRVPPDVTQDVHIAGLPIGTRGGILIHHNFPQDGDYEITVRLARDRNEHVEGLKESHQMELLIDDSRVELFTVRPPNGKTDTSGKTDPNDPWQKPTHANIDRHLTLRTSIKSGPHHVGVTFLPKTPSLIETARQPLNVHYNMYRHPRLGPAVFQVSITGPYESKGPGETPSRKQIFVCYPEDESAEDSCAEEIITQLLERATKGPVSEADLAKPMQLYREQCDRNGFEAGIEMAISAILIHPRFLFRIEHEPSEASREQTFALTDLELASRLSFFLWSSLPDDELRSIATQGKLRDEGVLEQQVMRMLSDERSHSLVTNFATQWLYLSNLDSITPDSRLYPDFDDNLRQSFRRETELFVESVFQQDRSVVELLKSDHTFLNERLAQHYGIPHVFGSHFRRVALNPEDRRGGLLRHGSMLTVTSYATRTSPVLRGKWILENLLGTPPPPPPPDVPDLADNVISNKLPVRERLAQHRADPACATCHDLIDPIGFALENYDAVGRWRFTDQGKVVDATGGLPGRDSSIGIDGLEDGLVAHPEMFVETMTEKLLTFAVGRGLNHYDGPVVRRIVRDAKVDDYRFSKLVLGIVQSPPFQMKSSR